MLLDELKKRLEEVMKLGTAPLPAQAGRTPADRETRERLQSLGYTAAMAFIQLIVITVMSCSLALARIKTRRRLPRQRETTQPPLKQSTARLTI
jgi:hypothetical protein